MRPTHLVAFLVLLLLCLPAAPAHAGGVVSVCDEDHLQAALAGGGTVTFSCSGWISLANTIIISSDTTIDGSGQTVTLSGNSAVRLFVVNPVVSLTLNGLEVAWGSDTSNDGGGAIFSNGGDVTITDCLFDDNNAGFPGGSVASMGGTLNVVNSTFSGDSAPGGGAIASAGAMVTVSGSTFVAESAAPGQIAGGYGGAIYADQGQVTISNSTFEQNSATVDGGAIVADTSQVTVINSTFDNNTANGSGNAIASVDSSTVVLRNTIVASTGTPGSNCYGPISDGGGNLSYPDATCPGIQGNPRLQTLTDNGGPTFTMALAAGSPAIDAANTATCQAAPVSSLDQRGYARFVDGNGDSVARCDIGAFEYGSTGAGTFTPEGDPPVVAIALGPQEPGGPHGWYLGPVVVKPQASDASPVVELRCALDPAHPPAAFDDLPETICPFLGGAPVTTGGRHTFYAAGMDLWGNKSAPASARFAIRALPTGLTSLEKEVNRQQAFPGSILKYQLKVKNLTPVPQKFELTDTIPGGTTFVMGGRHNRAARTVTWKGIVRPRGVAVMQLWLRVNRDVPGGTVIVNLATVKDSAGSDSASAETTVVKPPPHPGPHVDADLDETGLGDD